MCTCSPGDRYIFYIKIECTIHIPATQCQCLQQFISIAHVGFLCWVFFQHLLNNPTCLLNSIGSGILYIQVLCLNAAFFCVFFLVKTFLMNAKKCSIVWWNDFDYDYNFRCYRCSLHWIWILQRTHRMHTDSGQNKMRQNFVCYYVGPFEWFAKCLVPLWITKSN